MVQAIVDGLGAVLSPTYYPGKLEIQAGHISRAKDSFEMAANYDREQADVVFKLGEY